MSTTGVAAKGFANPTRFHLPDLSTCRITLLIFIVLAVVLVSALQFFHELDARKYRAANLIASERNIIRSRYEFRNFIGDALSNLLAVAGSPQVRSLSLSAQGEPDPVAREQVTELFYRLLYHKPNFAQLRCIDMTGEELIRVQRNNHSGRIEEISHDALQTKADRYYFKDAISLPDNHVYVSPLDLNVEYGQIEMPWQPVIRVVKPIHDASGNRGVIVLNVSARNFLRNFSIGNSIQRTTALLNGDGFWLAGMPDDMLWGFMFDSNNNLKVTHPQLWQQIMTEGQGEAVIEHRHYLFSSITPGDVVEEEMLNSALSGYQLDADDERWVFLSVYNEPLPIWAGENLPRLITVLLIAFLTSVFISRTMAARKHAEKINEKNEEKLQQMERLASLGTVVAGVAHEVNTPVGNALTIASTVREHAQELNEGIRCGKIGRNRLDTLLADIDNGTVMLTESLRRASNIIQNFKQVAVDQTSERRRCFHLDEFLHELVALQATQFRGSAISIKVDCDSHQMVDSLPGPLGQVISNLIANARIHAFEEGASGQITLEACSVSHDKIMIRVSDNGQGIPTSLQAKIFDPFFTTKMNTGGSGLGLSIVQIIVNSLLQGDIAVSSQPGQGTHFTLIIPARLPEASTSLNTSASNSKTEEPVTGSN